MSLVSTNAPSSSLESTDDLIVVLDSRETHLKVELEKLQKQGKIPAKSWKIEQLVIGDVIYRKGSQVLLIMERKTTPDMYSAITTKRHPEQRERLKQANTFVIYLLEAYGEGLSSFVPQSAMKMVAGAVENLILYDNIKVIPTIDLQHSAVTIVNVWKKLSKNPDIAYREKTNSVQGIMASRKGKIMENMFKHQLLLIPGVSEKVADVITTCYPSINALTTAYEELPSDDKTAQNLLADLKVGKKRLGPTLSARIHQIYTKGKVKIANENNSET